MKKIKNKMPMAILITAILGISVQVITFLMVYAIDNDPSLISYSASINEIYTNAVNISNNKPRNHVPEEKITDMKLVIQNVSTNSKVTGTITMYYGDDILISESVNRYLETFDGADGYVGVLDGFITVDISENGKETRERLTVDLNYLSPTENFTAVTIGAVGAKVSQILFFGNKSECLTKLMNINAEISMKTNSKQHDS